MKVTRPLLRYFGGKWQLRHWILGYMPEHQFYAEPFAGAASILLAKEPAPGGEIINDLNRELINLFRIMQNSKQSEELIRRLDWTPFAKAELTIAQESSDEPIEAARRLVIRSFMGIEAPGIAGLKKTGMRMGNVGLNRLNKHGVRTIRNCAVDWCNWKHALPAIRDRLARVMIYERDALEFIDLMDAEDCLLYVDPPYQHGTRSNTRYAIEFEQHGALAERLSKCKSKVLLSGYRCAEYEVLTNAGWQRVEKDYRANMSPERRTECLWISPNAIALPIPGLQLA